MGCGESKIRRIQLSSKEDWDLDQWEPGPGDRRGTYFENKQNPKSTFQ